MPRQNHQNSRNDNNKTNIGTFLGIIAGLGLIGVAIYRGGAFDVFLSLNSLLIVVGGTLATTLIAFPHHELFNLFPVTINAFKPEIYQPSDYTEQMIKLADYYRKGGVKTLESQEDLLDNYFLKQGVRLIVDGYRGREIEEIMDAEIHSLRQRHENGQNILEFMANQAPVFGMAGTLIGLIQMLMRLQDPENIGPALGVALVTTFYGLLIANLIVNPILGKLKTRTENEIMLIMAIKVGISGIQKKLNPHKIQTQINSFLPKSQRKD